MELTEDEIAEKYGKLGGHCNRKTLLPYKDDFTCKSCGFNVIKRKHELSKIQRKKNKFYQSIKKCRTKNILNMRRCIENL